MSTISVIVPVYKVEKYLKRCVDSILSQSFSSFELVLVDDGSPDSCGKICDEYGQSDTRVHVIHQKYQGVAEARNTGIKWALYLCDSEWVNFVDSDDWIHRDYLKLLYETAITYGVGLSICNFLKTSELDVQTKETPSRDVKLFSAEDFWLFRQYGTVWAKLYKKSDFQDIRFPKGLVYEDAFVIPRLFFMQERIAYIEEPLYYYYQREDSITNKKWTPDILAELKGIRQLIFFFKKNKYLHALEATVSRYFRRIRTQIEAVETQKDLYKRYYYGLHALYRIDLIRYSKYLPIQQYTNIYRYGFPLYTKVYKKIKHLTEKGKKR